MSSNQDIQDFNDWVKEKGIQFPHLGINCPAGNAWGAAEDMCRILRLYREERLGVKR